jgi:uncharacterized protein
MTGPVTEHDLGCTVLLHVKPGARREGIVGVRAGRLELAVHAAPEKGKANKAVVALLAKALGLRKGQVALLSGETSRDKRVLVTGLSPDQARERIACVAPQSPTTASWG